MQENAPVRGRLTLCSLLCGLAVHPCPAVEARYGHRRHATSSANHSASVWSCAVSEDFSCPEFDELPLDHGCQVSCRNTVQCARGLEICSKIPSCVDASVNSAFTWATLKRPTARGGRGGPVPDTWCPPGLRLPGSKHAPECTKRSAMCVVIARMVSFVEHSATLEDSLPRTLPSLIAERAQYPVSRHAAATHLAYIFGQYESLPRSLALVIDYGDRHAESGCNVCAQAMQLRAIDSAQPKLFQNPRLFKSLAPLLVLPRRRHVPAAGFMNTSNISFRCIRHVLTLAETAMWSKLLSATLGPPPESVHAYAGGQLLVSRKKIRSLPRELWGELLKQVCRLGVTCLVATAPDCSMRQSMPNSVAGHDCDELQLDGSWLVRVAVGGG